MKPLFLPLLVSALGLALSAAPSLAQFAPTPITGTFTIPTDVDPDSVTFQATGQTFTTTDAPSNQLITGQLLSPNGGGGLNIFAAVPGPIGNAATTIPIVEVDFFTSYTGPITLVSLAGAGSGATPWFAEMLNPPVGQGFRFFKTLPTQANINTTDPINDPTEYALFTLTPDNPNDPNNALFFNSTFTVTGFTSVQNVPEPGTIALFGALAVSGGVAWRRRRRTV